MRCLSHLSLCLVLLGCNQHRAVTEALVAAAPSAAKAPSGAGVESAPEPVSAAVAASTAVAITDRSARGAERLVIREAQLRLRSANPRTVADSAARIAGAAGGFVLTSDVQGVDGKVREVTVDLRVPEATLDGTLRKLRALGTVMRETVTGQDVTEEFVDVSARLRAQTTLEARLLSLLEGSAQMRDMLTVEQELARVRGDIERMQGRIRYLKERSQLSSIHLAPRFFWWQAAARPRKPHARRRCPKPPWRPR